MSLKCTVFDLFDL